MRKIFKKKNKGFTLLFAVLVSTLVLSVGASIISIALKQIILSGSARDSQFAFYAANTGIECGLYWDLIGIDGVSEPVFATSSESAIPSSASIACGASRNITIDGDTYDESDENDVWDLQADIDSATTTFRVLIENVEYCADISVSKYQDSSDRTRTIINSRGYNTCDENNARRIERGLRITY